MVPIQLVIHHGRGAKARRTAGVEEGVGVGIAAQAAEVGKLDAAADQQPQRVVGRRLPDQAAIEAPGGEVAVPVGIGEGIALPARSRCGSNPAYRSGPHW